MPQQESITNLGKEEMAIYQMLEVSSKNSIYFRRAMRAFVKEHFKVDMVDTYNDL
jgi:hypothetical protein